MIVPDVNLLIYAFRKEYPQHAGVRGWLQEVLAGPEPVGLHGMVECAFVRLATKPLGSLRAAPVEEALAFVGGLRSAAVARRVAEGARHGEILGELVVAHGLAGDRINDAWLAAVAIEQGATLASADAGFEKYEALRWINPAAPE